MQLMSTTTVSELCWMLERARPARLRSMRRFAEEEIVIPDGPFAGRRFRVERQPYTGLWFDAVDSGNWSRLVATGPTQSGKTLSCFVVPLLYHLFEMGETVICGLPDMDMAADKWREDILPAIEQSRFRDLLPTSGGGSRGGRVESVQFRHGPTLKFMSGGGGDKSRAGFTSRVVVITETDGMDKPGAASRESDKITQLEARTRAYGLRRRIYMECTVSTEEGRTWREYSEGTKSRIMLPCPKCAAWVSPEREQLAGWQEAESLVAAREGSAFACPECGELWEEDDRRQANLDSRLVHDGQAIVGDGQIEGDPPQTDTLGFRYSAINNLFVTAAEVGGDEWRARRSTDEENSEREMRQFVWCVPVAPTSWEEINLAVGELVERTSAPTRGIVPKDTNQLTAGFDVGKRLAHWVIVAWGPGATGHVVDYGRIAVASDRLGTEQAILEALQGFRAQVEAGFPVEGGGASPRVPDRVFIDAGYMTEAVYRFCREAKQRFLPAVGRGATQQARRQMYNRPTRTGSVTKYVGRGFHVNRLPAERLYLAEVDADHWKTWVHQRLATPVGQSGALTLFDAPKFEHQDFCRQLTAEAKLDEFVPGRGVVVRWERVRRANHWFDALYNAAAAGYFAGARLLEEEQRVAERRGGPTQQEIEEENMRRWGRKSWVDAGRVRRLHESMRRRRNW
jgi:phage terminase large subunit GpA-like protein